MKSWEAKDLQYLTEPAFVANPQGSEEDDGLSKNSYHQISYMLYLLFDTVLDGFRRTGVHHARLRRK